MLLLILLYSDGYRLNYWLYDKLIFLVHGDATDSLIFTVNVNFGHSNPCNRYNVNLSKCPEAINPIQNDLLEFNSSGHTYLSSG